jgi:hypothetical protein
MSFSTLRQRLDDLSGQIQPDKQLEALNPDSGIYELVSNRSVDDGNGLVKQIVEVLETIPELSEYKNGIVRSSPSAEGTVDLSVIANWALAQRRLRSADEIVQRLQEFVSTNSAPMTEVIALWGLHPKSPIKLTDEVYLVRITDLVPSEARDTVTGTEQNRSGRRSLLPRPRCTAAIKRNFKHENILLKPEERSKSLIAPMENVPVTDSFPNFVNTLFERFQEHMRTYPKNRVPDPNTTRMKEIVRCLCLLKNSSVCELAHWYECPLSTPLIGGVAGWSSQRMEHIFQFAPEPENYDEISGRRLVEHFLSLSDGDRKRLYVPLSRLNTALRETDSPVDKALDLGIALESLMGDKDPLDLSYKVRHRGAFFLGGTPDQRRYNFDCFKQLYKLRSKAAHGKNLGSTVSVFGKQMATEQFLNECCIICAQFIRKSIDSGLVSDWDEVMLGFSKT